MAMTAQNSSSRRSAHHRGQRGIAAVEFALVAILFFTLLLGIMEFGRWLFVLNSANEATRLGARLAVVCSISSSGAIRQRMTNMTIGIPVAQMDIAYFPSGCDASNCKTVIAKITAGASFSPVSPFFGGNYPIPQFPVSLPRESMNSTNNPVCP
jgi:hypothetical protein